jgi:hypothetical protein
MAFSDLLNIMLLLISGLTIFTAGLGANFEYDLKRISALLYQIPDDGDQVGTRNVGFIQILDAADSPRALH